MPNGDEQTVAAAKAFLDRQGLEYEEADEQYCTKLTVRRASQKAHLNVYNSGKLVVGGADSPLKEFFTEFKSAYESGEGLPGGVLPFEIDALPEKIQERVPEVDPIIIRFVEEAIYAIKANCLLSAAFMLGAASEKAIFLLVESYADAIDDEGNREKFRQRIGKSKIITHRFEEFRKSYASCKSKPDDPVLSQDLDTIIGGVFQFCRITRNEIGHPQIVPDLDKGAILANLGHFSEYIGRVYGLKRHFEQNGVVV